MKVTELDIYRFAHEAQYGIFAAAWGYFRTEALETGGRIARIEVEGDSLVIHMVGGTKPWVLMLGDAHPDLAVNTIQAVAKHYAQMSVLH